MGCQGVLVRVPAYPYCLQTLMPDRALACLAGDLERRNLRAELRDYCGLHSLERAVAKARRGRCDAAMADYVAQDLGRRPRPDYVVFRVEDSRQESMVDRAIRAAWSSGDRPVTVVWNPGSNSVPRALERFERCGVTWTSASAEALGTALERMASGERFLAPCGSEGTVGAGQSTPNYGRRVYGDVHRGGMVRVFTVGEPHSTDGPVANLVREMREAARLTGGAAFHVRCPEGIGANRLALAIRASGVTMGYSYSGTVAQLDAQSSADLASTGCRAVSVRVDSGSQYVLDRYYVSPWTVSETERVLRSSRFAGLYTVAEFTYPCSLDDRHTRAETERIVRRCRPNGFVIHPARPGSGSEVRSLRASMNAYGVANGMAAEVALMAELAGHRGSEAAFLASVDRQFRALDFAGLRPVVERINRGAADACAEPTRSAARVYPDVIGN